MKCAAIPVTEIQTPSTAAGCSRLRKVVCRLANAALRDPEAVADVELAVGEAFTNAVKYGAAVCKVSVRVESSSSREMAVEMTYPGRRFDTRITPPKDIANAEGGFGRYIMQQVTDSMQYNFHNGHTTVRMTKRR